MILRPCAKINLNLRVGPARPDGFHDVRTLMQSIALSDTLRIDRVRGPMTLTSPTPGLDIPLDETNLVWRAASALWRALGRAGEPSGVRIALDKQIPAAAGLGGGSADAAATLVGLNKIWRGGLAMAELRALAAGLGSDIAFFLQGGTALGVGRGEEIYPVDDIRSRAVVIVTPRFGVSTADAYRWVDQWRAEGGTPPVSAWLDVGWRGGPVEISNDLQPAVAARHPEIAGMIRALNRLGAKASAMSGSGSAVFGLFAKPLTQKALIALRRRGWAVVATRTLERREAARQVGL